MRFAIKTAPQHTTWADMLAVWQACRRHRLFESAWNFDHFYPIFSDPTGPVPRRRGRRSPRWRRRPDGIRRRCARDRQHLSPPGGAREHGRDGRRHLERPARARHRRGLEPAGVRRLRHRRCPRCASGSTCSTRRAKCIIKLLSDDDVRLRRSLLPAERRALRAEAGAAPASADLHRRRGRASARCGPSRGTRSTGTCPAATSRASSKSATCSARTAPTIGRDLSRSRPPPTCASTRTGTSRRSWTTAAVERRRPRPRHRLPPAAAYGPRCSSRWPMRSRRWSDGLAGPCLGARLGARPGPPDPRARGCVGSARVPPRRCGRGPPRDRPDARAGAGRPRWARPDDPRRDRARPRALDL